LGFCRDLHYHPAKIFIQNGIPITINPDDYFCFGVKGVTMDFFLTVIYMEFDLRDLKWVLENSIKYSLLNEDEIGRVKKNFELKWKNFIQKMN